MEHSEHADARDYNEQIGQNFALGAIRYILDGDFERGMGILRVSRNTTGRVTGDAIKNAEEAEKKEAQKKTDYSTGLVTLPHSL